MFCNAKSMQISGQSFLALSIYPVYPVIIAVLASSYRLTANSGNGRDSLNCPQFENLLRNAGRKPRDPFLRDCEISACAGKTGVSFKFARRFA